MPKVLIAPATLAGVDASFRTILEDAGFELAWPPFVRQLTEGELIEQLAGVIASLAGSEPYTPRVMAAHPQLRVIARSGVGYDAVDIAAATERGIAVAYAPGSNHHAVAEHTFTLMLALAKCLMPLHQSTKAGNWPRQANLPLRGRTLGIAGLGRIGKAVAQRGLAFGMRVIAVEPLPDQAFVAQHKIPLVTLDELLAESDFLSLHVPLTPETRRLINAKTLRRMKPTAYLINTSRGGVVAEAELIGELKAGTIAGAGLDVFENEPLLLSELHTLDNVVLTPHVAGVDIRSRDDMAEAAAQAIVDLSRGQWPEEKIVNPQVRSKFKW